MNWGGRQEERDKLLDAFPWMQDYFGYGSLNVPVGPFIDRNYSPNNFLNGAYDITNGLNVGLLADAYNVLKSDMWTHHPNTIKDDYSGHEDYMAGYLSMELNFGSELTVIPGIRFESNQTTYTANRGNETIFLAQEKYQYKDTTTARENNFWLPNLHVKYRPVDWINIKFAYTQTLTRPSYAQIIPKWNIGSTNVTMGNPYLKAATSENFDLNISVYENYVGLLAVGGFLKRIENLIFYTGKRAITDPAELGLPSNTLGMTYTTFINNNYNVDVWGLETEWQTHFWYLPGILKGFVFNINYTHIFSEAKYPQTTIQSIFNPNGPPYFVSTNIDTFYTNRLINQPDDIINASLGYDYKGFSARISLLFQSNIFKKNNPQPELKGYTEDYLRWDLVINQKLPLKGMMLYFNFNNITGSFDRAIVAGPQFPTSEQHYGYTVDLGLRYNF
jgi:TonB-dependent receptor